MHDLDRVRDKIEIRLEPRQVVFLAVGTMLFSGLLFAGGFMLGRNQAVVRSQAEVDLAAAEESARAAEEETFTGTRAAALGEVEFMFPSALGSRPGRAAPKRRPMRLPAEELSIKLDAPAEKAQAVEPTKAPVAVRAAPADPKPVVRTPAPIAPAPVAPKPVTPKPIVDAAPAVAEVIPAPGNEDAPAAPAKPIELQPEPTAPPPEPVAKSSARGRYTVQVKAVQAKAEADAFMAELRQSGFKPHVVLADIPGKGRFYRIRVGRFESMREARMFQRQYKRRSGQPDGGFVTDL